MAGVSSIEWTDRTWNPIVGCSIVSPGCTNCYAMKMAARLEAMGVPHYQDLTRKVNGKPVWTGVMRAAPDHILTEPLRWRKPQRIFVNSMSDLFGENVTDEQIDRVFAVMALTPQHTYQVLTKRAARMRAYMIDRAPKLARSMIDEWIIAAPDRVPQARRSKALRWPVKSIGDIDLPDDVIVDPWPLPNVWLGVSAEDQARADERIPHLLATPAAVRFASLEPLLGPIKLHRLHQPYPKLDWVIVGGESGAGARPMLPDWARQIRDDCARAGVPFFFKQWGEWLDESIATASGAAPGPDMFDRFGAPIGPKWHPHEASDRNGGMMVRIGKKAAGRLLDGVTHDAMPGVRS